MTTAPSSTETRPEWYIDIRDQFRAGIADTFLVHGETEDYVTPKTPVQKYLSLVLSSAMPYQVFFRMDEISSPITFLSDQAHTMFEQVCGLGAPGADPTGDLLGGPAPAGNQKWARLPDDPVECVRLLLRFLRDAPPRKAVVFVNHIDLLCPPADKGTMSGQAKSLLALFKRAGVDEDLARGGNMLFLLAPALTDIHPDLRSVSAGIHTVEVSMPDYARRFRFISDLLIQQIESAISPDEFAGLTAGLYLRHIEDIALRAKYEATPVTRTLVTDRKSRIIKNEAAGLLTVSEPRFGFDKVGGMAYYKPWAQRWIIDPARSGDPEQLATMPLSVLFSGPPGTGKTWGAEALAQEIGWNYIQYEQIKGGIVGETEKNDAKAERIIRASLPAVVFMDEVDQMGGRVVGGGGGGGDAVEKALFRNRLRFMGDTSLRGRILWVAASNRPDQIDDAMTSRFEFRIPFLPPETLEERADMLVRMLAFHGQAGVPASDLMDAATVMNGWGGRDMDQAVVKALGLMRLDKLPVHVAVTQAARTRRPLQRADAELMTKLAIADCNDLELLPPAYREIQETTDRVKLNREIAATRRASGAVETGREARDLDI